VFRHERRRPTDQVLSKAVHGKPLRYRVEVKRFAISQSGRLEHAPEPEPQGLPLQKEKKTLAHRAREGVRSIGAGVTATMLSTDDGPHASTSSAAPSRSARVLRTLPLVGLLATAALLGFSAMRGGSAGAAPDKLRLSVGKPFVQGIISVFVMKVDQITLNKPPSTWAFNEVGECMRHGLREVRPRQALRAPLGWGGVRGQSVAHRHMGMQAASHRERHAPPRVRWARFLSGPEGETMGRWKAGMAVGRLFRSPEVRPMAWCGNLSKRSASVRGFASFQLGARGLAARGMAAPRVCHRAICGRSIFVALAHDYSSHFCQRPF
jgi:hypothetical protein